MTGTGRIAGEAASSDELARLTYSSSTWAEPRFIAVTAQDAVAGATADPAILRRVVSMGSYWPILAVSLGGILGANARYLVGVYVAERLGAAFPYGTLLVNVSGSLVIGFFLTLVSERFTVDPLWRLFFATGFLGAYTTFSSYTFEAAQLIRSGAYALACLYVFGSVVAGLIGVFAGIVAAERL